MSITINTNIPALFAKRNLNRANSSMITSMERLSSGYRINSAKDDAAVLAIASRFTAQIKGYNQGRRNAADAISYAQTAEGALNELSSNLQRIRELAVQSVNAINSSIDRQALQDEVDQLTQEISRNVQAAEFNGTKIFMGGSDLTFQVSPNSSSTDKITVASVNLATVSGGTQAEYDAAQQVVNSMGSVTDGVAELVNIAGVGGYSALISWGNRVSVRGTGPNFNIEISEIHQSSDPAVNAALATLDYAVSNSINTDPPSDIKARAQVKANTYKPTTESGLNSYNTDTSAAKTVDISNSTSARTAINSMDEDIKLINKHRASFGALQNRFESVIRNAENTSENLSASRSRIKDTDFAQETANLVRNQIIEQVGVSILSQANSLPQTALSLLQV